MSKLVKRTEIIEQFLTNGVKCVTIIKTLNERHMHILTDGTTITTLHPIQVLSANTEIHEIKCSTEYAEFFKMIEKSNNNIPTFDVLSMMRN